METGDHKYIHKLVSSSAANSTVEHAELGVVGELHKREQQSPSVGGDVPEKKTEDLLFSSGVLKGKQLPSGADISEFIRHESRTTVPTKPYNPITERTGKETTDEESSVTNNTLNIKSAGVSFSDTGEDIQQVLTASINEKDNVRIVKEANFDEKRDNDLKSQSSHIQLKTEQGNTSQHKSELFPSVTRETDVKKSELETKQAMSANTNTSHSSVEEIKHNADFEQKTESIKTDMEGSRLHENFGISPSAQILNSKQTATVELKEAALQNDKVKESKIVQADNSENKLDPFVENESSVVGARVEINQNSVAENHKGFISHEAGTKDSDNLKKSSGLESKQDPIIHEEQAGDTENEKKEYDLIKSADKMLQEEKKGVVNEMAVEEQKESENNREQQESNKQEEWLDILGSGQLKKKVIRKAENSFRPQNSYICEINLEGRLEDGSIVEKYENLKIQIGDVEVIQGIDLALPLMDVGEVAFLEVGPRFAYGHIGRIPDIPPDAKLIYSIELLSAENEPGLESLSIAERRETGEKKRTRGNWWFSRQEYSFAIQSYRRAVEFLDEAEGGFSVEKNEVSENTEKQLQDLLEDRLKVFNNLAAAQMKIKAYDAALTSVENVLRCQPQNVKALFRKGKILAAKGDNMNALSILRNASQLEPDSKVIKQEVQRVLDVIKHDTKQEKSLYKKMLGQNTNPENNASKGSRLSYRTWGILCSSVAVVILGVVAYRYKFL